MGRKKGKPLPGKKTSEQSYTDDELEILKAIDAFRRKNGRVPSLVEVFRIARGFGWEKAAPGE